MLLKPEECVMLLVDFQAGLGFGVESDSRQALLNNAVALARTAAAFNVPVVVSTSASRVYSGPLLPALQDALPSVKAIERKNMNVWEDDTARHAVVAAGRKRLIVGDSSPKPASHFQCCRPWPTDSTCSSLGMRAAGSRRLATSSRCAGWSRPALACAAGYRCCWSFSATGRDTPLTKRHAPSWSRTAAVMEWDSRMRGR
jgi:hypothetical protein